MSFVNNQTTYINEANSVGETFIRNSVAPHTSGANQDVQVICSNLQPTATEFQPSGSSNGAIKKELQRYSYNKYNKSSRSNSYGSGRTFSNSRGFKRYERPEELLASEDFSYNRYKNDDQSKNCPPYSSAQRQNEYLENTSTNTHSSFSQNSFSYDHPNSFYNKNLSSKNNYTQKYKNHRGFNSNHEEFNKQSFKRTEKFSQNKFKREYNQYTDRNNFYHKKEQVSNRTMNINGNSVENDEFEDCQNSKFKPLETNYDSKFERRNTKEYRKNMKDNANQHTSYKKKSDRSIITKKVNAASQKERLEEMIYNRILECLVCCEKIKNNDKVWSCQLCYHIFHLDCVIAWAKSSKMENGWRCPACQNVCSEVPNQYRCYCGKTTEPKSSPGTIAHGCGDICLRKGRTCSHKCTLLCHPGPCPDCSIMVTKRCGCGATSPVVKCSTAVEIVCGNVCNKPLECGIHRCEKLCHADECDLCSETVRQECYCGKTGRKVPCRAQYQGKGQYECKEICGKTLACGNHTCKKNCHEGPCEICIRDVEKIRTCPCGKKILENPRESCLDPIPCCDEVCGKLLKCGQPGFRHNCSQRCHEGDCPPCPLTTIVKCRCGHVDKELPCQKLINNPDDTRCEKKCTKKRLCGKHKCNQRCCIEVDHICPLPCNHLLSCGQHRCQLTCHSGRCPPCVETSFEELYCECGASVLYPPIPCGTKPPSCNKPCSRPRACKHEVNHNCHTGSCPPCTVLCKKWCHGHHEQRSAILCHQDNFSCGLPCGKEMPCGKHKCNKPCHIGPCSSICNQPCTIPRRLCGHICGKPCHHPPCPESGCKQKVPVTCICGLQKSTRPCIEVAEEFKNIEMAQLKEKIGTAAKDQVVDISDIVSNTVKPSVLKILECNEECRIFERNRRLAIGLQIINPDLSQKLTPKYSDFLRQWAKKDSHFCQRVHDRLTDLVQLAKQSKQRSRSYSFDSMNKDKRHFIHEYCEHFGIETAAYDREPNRNVVATAIRDKSWLPSMSLLETIQRENGQRKVPGPISVSSRSSLGKSETVSLKLPSRAQRPISPPPVEAIDYFNSPT